MEKLFKLCKNWDTISKEESEEVEKYFQEYVEVANIKDLCIKCYSCMEKDEYIDVDVIMSFYSGYGMTYQYKLYPDNSIVGPNEIINRPGENLCDIEYNFR